MLGALVDVEDLGITNARVIAQIDRIGGYSLFKVQFNPTVGEINPSTIVCHDNEMKVVDDSKVVELGEVEFPLGTHIRIKHPIAVEGIVTGIVHSNSGCTEYEVEYKTERGLTANIVPAPIMEKVGYATAAGTQTGSMMRSVERRA